MRVAAIISSSTEPIFPQFKTITHETANLSPIIKIMTASAPRKLVDYTQRGKRMSKEQPPAETAKVKLYAFNATTLPRTRETTRILNNSDSGFSIPVVLDISCSQVMLNENSESSDTVVHNESQRHHRRGAEGTSAGNMGVIASKRPSLSSKRPITKPGRVSFMQLVLSDVWSFKCILHTSTVQVY